MHRNAIAIRVIAVGLGLLTLAAACSSSNASTATTPTTTTPTAKHPPAANASTSTSDPDLTPNSIPYVVGEQIGLPNGWLVTVTKVEKNYPAPGLPAAAAGQMYIAIDVTMKNQSTAADTVDANALFTLVDTSHRTHYVVKEPDTPNGIDGAYPVGAVHSGRLVFVAPTTEKLGLILYGPRIGTQISFFTIVPPTVPPADDLGP